MYSRSFSNLETDGQLLKIQKEREQELLKNLTFPKIGYNEIMEPEKINISSSNKDNKGVFNNLFGGILNDWSFDDLILIGLTLYLLTDKNEENDLLVILLVLLLT